MDTHVRDGIIPNNEKAKVIPVSIGRLVTIGVNAEWNVIESLKHSKFIICDMYES